MKAAILRSTAHNIADSLASGIGLMIGVYEMDVFGEASASAEGYIEVDFIRGTTSGSPVSLKLAEAIRLYAAALPAHCERNGVSVDDFRHMTARYFGGRAGVFEVETEGWDGKAWRDTYEGRPARRPLVNGRQGVVRRDRGQTFEPINGGVSRKD